MLLFFGSELLLTARFPVALLTLLYVATVAAGYISLLTAGTWISRLLKNQLMDDVFNDENESFMQERRLIANEYSVNLPTRFRYQRKTYSGWINVINPFRASLILGTPGSGKSYAIINNYIRQQIEKGFAAYIYGAPVKAISQSSLWQGLGKCSLKTTYHHRLICPTKGGRECSTSGQL